MQKYLAYVTKLITFVLDLHGNSLKKERCPDGSKDENVFDIQQGVAIGLFIKKSGLQKRICHAELWGLRETKYNWLEENDISTTKWAEIHPKSPSYLFVPRDETLLDRYQKYPKVTEIFPVNSVGIVSSRDDFVIDFEKEKLKRRIRMFRDKNVEDDLVRQTFEFKDKKGWKMADCRKAVMGDEKWEKKLTEILYRPFDVRWIFYHEDLIERPRREVMQHMLQENIGLITPKQFKEEPGAFVSRNITGHKTVSAFDINYLFPLYRYPELNKKDLLSSLRKATERKTNLNPTLVQTLSDAYHRQPSPEDIFCYIYAVLYAPSYRTKYAEFLKTDFPRVPFTKDVGLFGKLAKLGQRLVDLHLLKSSELDNPICRFQGKGGSRVEEQAYNPKEKRVYINKMQYFEGVQPGVYNYQIGGYQVLDKWLKDRKKRLLSMEDIKHYCRVVTALVKTIDIQAEIDKLYPDVEKRTLT